MATISSGDAEVALRSFPRRWSTLFARFEEDEDLDTDAALRHTGPDGRSALDGALRAADVLEEAQDHLHRTVTSDRPTLERRASRSQGGSLPGALRRIEEGAPALASALARVPTGDLDRGAEVDGQPTTVRELVSDAVGEVAALLRSSERALSDARAAQR